jgi:hypothetical protein
MGSEQACTSALLVLLLLLLLMQATIYVYQLVDGEVKVEKIDHTKATPAAAVTA